MTNEEIRKAAHEAAERTAREQGKPVVVEDPKVLEEIARIVRSANPKDER